MTHRFNAAGLTDVGRVRQNNEDAFLVSQEASLFVVADGMGGHQHGEWASAKLVEHLTAVPPGADFEAQIAVIANAVHMANAEVKAAAGEAGGTMGSTLVALYLNQGRFAAFWAGDSRTYLLRRNNLVQLTRDHTHVNDMLANGLLDPADAVDHPMKHALSRAIGVQDDLELDVVCDEVQTGDVFMLCSDGLTGVVSDREIAACLSEGVPERASRLLIDLALARGGPDNITVVVVICDEATLLRFAEPVDEASS